MPRIYLVVQNNVRTGPFTLEELLQQPLQANAMVWIIGQSEDWLSPVEIPSLQAYYTRHSDGSFSVNKTVLEDIRTKRFAAPVDSPRTEPSRAGVLDAHMLEQPIATNTAPVNTGLKEDPTIPARVVSVAGAVQKEPTGSIRKETTNERTSEKEDDSITVAKKNWAVVGIAMLLIVFVTWNALFNDGPRIKRNMAYATAASVLDTVTTTTAHTTSSFEPPVSADDLSEPVPITEDKTPIVMPDYAARPMQAASTDAFLDSVQRVLDSQDQLMAAVDDACRKSFLYRKRYNHTKAPARSAGKITNRPLRQQAASIKPSSEVAKVPLSQQVDLQSRLILDKNKQQVNSVELVVKNNSKQILKTVSVDVYYYKKGEKLLNKETVYFSNLYPKQSLTKSIAGNQRATSTRFQLGLITTGKN